MDENLESLFEDVFNGEPADQGAPADDNGQQGSNAPSQPETEQKEQKEQKDPMPPEERARQAHGRRMREAEERAFQRGIAAARESMNANLRLMGGLEKPDGDRITTVDEFDAFVKQDSENRVNTGRARGDDLRRIVREELQAVQQPVRQENQISPEDRAQIDRQLAEIRQEDPEMRDLNAILQSDAGPKFRELVEKGLDFKDAYELAAKDRLASIRANRAGAKGTGKDHLTATNQRGTGALDVPREELAWYKEINPDASDDEIRKHYNANRKRTG